MCKYFVAPPTLCRWAKDLIAKRGPLAPAIVGVPRFSLAFGERKAGRGKNGRVRAAVSYQISLPPARGRWRA